MAPHGVRRANALYALSNAGTSAAGVLIPLLARELGASDLELGLIGAGFGATFFLSAWVFGRLADTGARLAIIRLGLAASALAAPLHLLAHDPWTLGLARAAFGFAAGVSPAALIAYAYDAQRRPGRFAGWGSLGFGIGTVAAGLAGGWDGVYTFATFALFASFLLALRLAPRPEARVRVPWLPREVIANNLPAYLAVLVRHIGAAAVWIVFPLYLLQLGASPAIIGGLYFLNTGSQFLFMGFLDRFRASALVIGGLLASSAVFLLFWAATSWVFILPVQLLLALSWALLYVGALAFVMERNVERATSTGLLHSTLSLSNVIGPLLGGAVSHAAGYGATMLLAAALSLLGVPLFILSAARSARRERAARDVVVQPPVEPAGE